MASGTDGWEWGGLINGNFHFGGIFPVKGHHIASLASAVSLAQTEGTDLGIAEDEGVLI